MKREAQKVGLAVAVNRSIVGRFLGELLDVVVIGAVLCLFLVAGWVMILWDLVPDVLHPLVKIALLVLFLRWCDSKWNHGRVWGYLTGKVQTRTIGTRPSAVYRFYDHEGVLLYIGKAVDPDAREKQHRSDPRKRHWTRRIHRRVDEWHPSEAEAFAAESRAIATEDPWFNAAGNG